MNEQNFTQGQNGVKIYSSAQLSSDRYHSEEFPQASGSILTEIYQDCEAAWRFGEEKESKAMSAGVAGHAHLLEPAVFDATYCRSINPDDHEDALIANKDMEQWLKALGIKSTSGKNKDELLQMIDDAVCADVPMPKIMCRMLETQEQMAILAGITVVPFKVYDTVKKMREYLFNNGYGRLFENGETEVSLVDEEGGLKVRQDLINPRGDLIDYKTTTSAHPEKFGAQAARMGYYLKMALQSDLYEKAYGRPPERVILLAQSTKPPYIAQAYEMTAEQLQAGRDMYQGALKKYNLSVATNSWPAYGGGVQPLWTPPYIARDLGFDMDSGVEFIED